jgi:hypothetical protein
MQGILYGNYFLHAGVRGAEVRRGGEGRGGKVTCMQTPMHTHPRPRSFFPWRLVAQSAVLCFRGGGTARLSCDACGSPLHLRIACAVRCARQEFICPSISRESRVSSRSLKGSNFPEDPRDEGSCPISPLCKQPSADACGFPLHLHIICDVQ